MKKLTPAEERAIEEINSRKERDKLLRKKVAGRKVRDKQISFMDNQSTLSGKIRKLCECKVSKKPRPQKKKKNVFGKVQEEAPLLRVAGEKYYAVSRPNTKVIPPSGKASLLVELTTIVQGEVFVFTEDLTKLVEITNRTEFEKNYSLV